MYYQITDEDGYQVPMRIFPAPHYTMGGLWVDYNLMTNIPGLFALGEANFSDHGANRLGASALMQGLADGFFIIPSTIGGYLGSNKFEPIDEKYEAALKAVKAVDEKIKKLFAVNGKKTPTDFHRQMGNVMWNGCGMSRNEQDLKQALKKIPEIREEFWKNVMVPGSDGELNPTLEKALKVADYLEFTELILRDAIERNESSGGHFREESATAEGEAKRNDADYSYVGAWQYDGEGKPPILNKEALTFENVKISERSYK
jgi:succinate dehydrogenase / fumarate reductase flavoprotein subunit